jgi:SAM-dependent methyltransferase
MIIRPQSHHWETIASHWRNVGCPLRPCPDDIGNYTKLIDPHGRDAIRALILGVTPELYHLAWPAGSTVQSADRSSAMIKAIWPGPPESATNTDWLDMPFPDESFDCVLCDGGMTLLEYPRSQQVLSSTLARILKRRGQFIIRLFENPDQSEKPAAVLSDLRAGNIPSVHVLKLRLAMALQRSAESGIVLEHVFETIIQEFGSLDGLYASTGWPQGEVSTLTSYYLSKDRYHFFTRQQAIEVLSSGGGLAFERGIESSYLLGERCPLLSFRKV